MFMSTSDSLHVSRAASKQMPLRLPYLMALSILAMVAVAFAFSLKIFIDNTLTGLNRWYLLTNVILLGIVLFLLVSSLLRSDYNMALGYAPELLLPVMDLGASSPRVSRRR